MINHKRVRRIKNAIYLFIILLFLVPAILLIILGVRLLGQLDSIQQRIDRLDEQVTVSQAQQPSPAGSGNSQTPATPASTSPDSSPSQTSQPEPSQAESSAPQQPETSSEPWASQPEDPPLSPGGGSTPLPEYYEPEDSTPEYYPGMKGSDFNPEDQPNTGL